MEVCSFSDNQASVNMLKDLPVYQGGAGRHKCAICAYNNGLQDGMVLKTYLGSYEICPHGSKAPLDVLKNIHDSQFGEGRHKCIVCAYQNGYIDGVEGCKNPSLILKNAKLTKESSTQSKPTRPIKKDYLTEQIHKTIIGQIGELLVVKFEQESGCEITHISLSNDGAGYDIESKNEDQIKYIEVKTTTSDENTPFYLTSNEKVFMESHKEDYYIYRVFDLDLQTHNGKVAIYNCDTIETQFEFNCQTFQVSRK